MVGTNEYHRDTTLLFGVHLVKILMWVNIILFKPVNILLQATFQIQKPTKVWYCIVILLAPYDLNY